MPSPLPSLQPYSASHTRCLSPSSGQWSLTFLWACLLSLAGALWCCAMSPCAVLSCARCAVLCYAALPCAVLCMLCCAVLCYATLCCAVLCTLCCAALRCLLHAELLCAVLRCNVPCYSMSNCIRLDTLKMQIATFQHPTVYITCDFL